MVATEHVNARPTNSVSTDFLVFAIAVRGAMSEILEYCMAQHCPQTRSPTALLFCRQLVVLLLSGRRAMGPVMPASARWAAPQSRSRPRSKQLLWLGAVW